MDPEKKENIVAAAVRCFTKYGFKKASIDEIAQEAGVAKGTVYLACESKEDLFYQAVHRELRGWVASVSKRIDPREQADQLLVKLAGISAQELEEKPLVRDLLVGVIHGQLPHWHDRLEELRALAVKPIEEILELGVRQGVFRDGLDLPEVARVMQDLEMVAYIRFLDEWNQDLTRLTRRVAAGADLILNGLRVESS